VAAMTANRIKSFEDLEVFQRAYALSLIIHKVSLNFHKVLLNFPRHEQFGFAEQIRRASKSICANIAEGFGKQRTRVRNFGGFC
jgi:four helix bundle protein